LQAAGTEAAQGMRAKVGLDKRSEHSVDRYGKEVSNLGTRAANRLDANAQASRETRVATTAAGQGNAPDISGSGLGSGSDCGEGTKDGTGSSGYADPTAAPAAENKSAQEVLSSIAKIKPTPLSSQLHADAGGGQIQDAVRRVKPPQVPHDGGSIEAPSIRLEGEE